MKINYDIIKIGTRFNSWEVISCDGKNKFGKNSYTCKCECGKLSRIEGRALLFGLSKSCGCKRKVDPKEKHERIKKYKQNYFQKNKKKIYKRIQKQIATIDPKVFKQKRKEYFYRSKYGLEISVFNEMLKAANNACMICKKPLTSESNNDTLCIDHDHTTGEVRGLLCKSCNCALGYLGDKLEMLKSAVEYLENYENRSTGNIPAKTCNDSENI